MSTITFDTLKYAERLENAGFTREQSKAEAEALSDVLSTGSQELVTKADQREMELRMASRFETLELRMTIKLGAFLSVAVGILIAVMRLPH